MDIVDIIHSHENLTTLAIAIANANFIPLLRNQKENFTIFAAGQFCKDKSALHCHCLLSDNKRRYTFLPATSILQLSPCALICSISYLSLL